MQRVKKQIVCFLLAVGFFTRIPIPKNTPYSLDLLNQSSRYFSLVGWIIGGLTTLSLWGALQILPISVAVIISMIVSIFLTGAFHEDGLADSADGLGGGMTLERKLSIMKDSRIGTYGAIALWAALFLKYALLTELAHININALLCAVLIMHPISRAVAGSFIYDMDYVRDDDAKAKPVADHQRLSDLIVLVLFGALSFAFLDSKTALFLFISQLLLRFYMKKALNKRLGGYTGDTLGGAQQISELIGYLVLLILFHQPYIT